MEIAEKGYSIEAEIGRLNIDTHKVKRRSRVIYDTRRDIFPPKAPLENYRTICFDELVLWLPCMDSYRKTDKILNRVRWQNKDAEIKHRTIANIIEKEGTEVLSHLEEKAVDILLKNGFNKNGLATENVKQDNISTQFDFLPEEKVFSAVEDYNEGKPKELQIELSGLHESYEDPETAVNISIDDVGAKKQKESGRDKYSKHKPKGSRQSVKNTVVHIQNADDSYVLNGPTIFRVLKLVIAFLLNNNLTTKGLLVFYVDGADDLRRGVYRLFKWIPFKIILDWYHIKKKCEQRLSQSIQGITNRNMVLEEVLAYLWVGKVDSAVQYLRQLDPKIVKSYENLEKLINYFDKNWSFIVCYALRQRLKMRNSSNRGEKANHLIVSERQKHNGMSWSKSGSVALATISAIHLNTEHDNWIRNRKVSFTFPNLNTAA